MSDWNPGDLRALAAYVLVEKGQWPGTLPADGHPARSTAAITAVADATFGHNRPGLSTEDLATVREHITDAVILIDGVPYGAEL